MRGIFEGWHIVVLLIVVLVLFGAKRLPDSARSLGKSMRIFKSEVRAMNEDGDERPAPRPADPRPIEGRVENTAAREQEPRVETPAPERTER